MPLSQLECIINEEDVARPCKVTVTVTARPAPVSK